MCMFDVEACKTIFEKKNGNGRNSDDYNPVRLMEITNSNNESLFGKHSGKPMLR